MGREYEIESENHIQGKLFNDEIIRGYKLLPRAFGVLPAIIGIVNILRKKSASDRTGRGRIVNKQRKAIKRQGIYQILREESAQNNMRIKL